MPIDIIVYFAESTSSLLLIFLNKRTRNENLNVSLHEKDESTQLLLFGARDRCYKVTSCNLLICYDLMHELDTGSI